MDNNIAYETRSRSRSKTPGLRMSVDRENGDAQEKRPVKKNPTISLIEEEDDIIEIIPISQPNQRPKRQRKSAKIITSDYSSDDISPDTSKLVSPSGQNNIGAKNLSTNSSSNKSITTTSVSTTTVTNIKKTTNGSGDNSHSSKFLEKTSLSSSSSSSKVAAAVTGTATNGSSEEASDNGKQQQNETMFTSMFNAIKTSTPKFSRMTKRITTGNISGSINVDNMSGSHFTTVNVAEHPAYKEYKEAGEYWNKYPKTDYTYSELSPHRREVGSGIVAMPNMSRRSLEKYQNRIETMIQKDPKNESFLRRRFLSNNVTVNKRSAELLYDSQDETDVVSSTTRSTLSIQREKSENVFYRLFMFIVNVFYASYYRVKSIFYRNVNDQYVFATPMPVGSRKNSQQVGIWNKMWSFIKYSFLTIVSKFYLFISTILFFDTWLLKAKSDNVEENKKKKRFIVVLLALFPLLLFGGVYLYLDPPQNIGFPKITLPKLTMPKINFPKLTLPEFNMPKFSMPTINWPKITIPTIKWPDIKIPTINWPSFEMPTMPKINWPTISIPKISMPTINVDMSETKVYLSEKFDWMRESIVELFDHIRVACRDFLSDAQIVWNENFNAK